MNGGLDSAPLGTTQRAAEIIRQGIRAGTFAPGQHLVEVDITSRLKISRSSFREALQQLAGEGLVTLNRYRGAYICILSRRTIDDLLALLEPLVTLAARRAAAVDDPAGKAELTASAERAAGDRRAGGENSSYLVLRQQFYDVLFRLADNNELPRVTPLGRADLFRAQIRPFQVIEQQRRHSEGYGRIAAAIVSGDAAAAGRAVADHFAETRAMLDQLPAEAFATED
jgi:DNA-binding GntR family transcriptional regulator